MNNKLNRESGICRYMGFNPEQQKSISDYFREKFMNHGDREIVEKYERKKSAEEQRMIEQILEKMPAFVEKWGGSPLKITPEHIHILVRENMDEKTRVELEGKETGAVYLYTRELIFILDSRNNIKNAHHVVHELIHFSSFQSLTRGASLENTFTTRRIGFEIHNKEEYIFFRDINEAITVELEKRFDSEHFESITLISKEIRQRNNIKKRAGKNGDDISLITEGESDAQKTQFLIEHYTYGKARQRLAEIIEKIYRKNPEEFTTKEEVFAVFAEATMSGKLLKIARFIEKTYDKGSFRKLGEETGKNL